MPEIKGFSMDQAACPGAKNTERPMQPDTITLWNPELPVPKPPLIPIPDRITHQMVERAVEGQYHYLHEAALAFHGGALFAGWANGPVLETNITDEVYRGRRSPDGGRTWEPVHVIAPGGPKTAHNHGVFLAHAGRLRAFVARWDIVSDEPYKHDRDAIARGIVRQSMEGFLYDDAAGAWRSIGEQLADFIPFDRPKRLDNGNWILAGETTFEGQPAVAISAGDDLTRWKRVAIPLPDGLGLRFPETTVLVDGPRITAIARGHYRQPALKGWPLAVAQAFQVAIGAESADYGESWSPVMPTNYPMGSSKPFADTLSDGRRILISNPPPDRNWLTLAVAGKGEPTFSRLWRIREGLSPNRFLKVAQWSYPSAIEHDGNLYVIYTVSKEDCALSIIPLEVLG